MRLVYGLFVFVAGLFLGIGAATVGNLVEPCMVMPEIEVAGPDTDKTEIAADNSDIHVAYAGICSVARDGGKVYLKFLIHNRTEHPLAYVGYFASHSFPLLKANGNLLPSAFICPRGSREFTIPPGRWAEVLVDREEFLSRPPKDVLVSTGFHLRPVSATESSVHYSEPFQLPEEFRNSIDGRDRR